MNVLILGAGVVGVTTAWYLNKAGFAVTVIDRQPGAGLETSFANGGQISPCHAEPWANPHVLGMALRWLGREDAPLKIRWRPDPYLALWLLRFLRNCTADRARINTERTLRVALYSRACLQALRADTGIEYDQQLHGILHIYRDRQALDFASAASTLMNQLGLDRRPQSVAEAVALEPALAPVADQLVGAIYTPGDESGDAHLFTRRLAERCAAAGVTFHYNTRIFGFEREGDRVSAVLTEAGRFRPDLCVLALASWSPLMARQLGLSLPVYPAKGYSLTLDVTAPQAAPRISITDDEHKIVISRLGERLRIAGTAELAGWNRDLRTSRSDAVLRHGRSLFPDAGDYQTAQPWCGLRAVTPDSVPLLGATRLRNFYLNTGHGTLGWTMACGCGQFMADLLQGRTPDIDPSGLGLDRFAGIGSWL